MVNQRRQSMQLSAASPLPMQHAPSSRLASGMLDTFSSINTDDNADMNMILEPELAEDEEFAAEEHAHRFALLITCSMPCQGLVHDGPQVQTLPPGTCEDTKIAWCIRLMHVLCDQMWADECPCNRCPCELAAWSAYENSKGSRIEAAAAGSYGHSSTTGPHNIGIKT